MLPYLLHYVIPDRPPHAARAAIANSAAAAAAFAHDTVPRALALCYLPRLIAQLSGLPRSERSLLNGYVMPALAALPERQSSLLRAQAAGGLAAVAQAAARLQESAVRAALDDEAGAQAVSHPTFFVSPLPLKHQDAI